MRKWANETTAGDGTSSSNSRVQTVLTLSGWEKRNLKNWKMREKERTSGTLAFAPCCPGLQRRYDLRHLRDRRHPCRQTRCHRHSCYIYQLSRRVEKKDLAPTSKQIPESLRTPPSHFQRWTSRVRLSPKSVSPDLKWNQALWLSIANLPR